MNDNVSVLHSNPTAPELGHALAATRSYTQAWQQGKFKSMPVIHESLERHMKLFINCGEQMARHAQRLVAEISSDPLRDILDALGGGDDDDLMGIADELLDTVKSLLEAQLSHLGKEQHALGALPAPAWASDEQRLLKQQQDLARLQVQLSEEHAREDQKKTAVEQAIATLEANGLQTRFEGVVPSLSDLSKLAAPGGEALVTAELVSKAVQQLQTLLGDVIEGMRYEQLHRERRLQRERVRALELQLQDITRGQATAQGNLAALALMPGLLEHRLGWVSAINVVRQALANFATRLGRHSARDAGEVRAMDALFKQLLSYQRQLLEQHRLSQ
ncbi:MULTISPECIES: alpha-xenorhabdolysin family binary toxin subunit B [Pseudomonas]|uniref:Uncharacterized protein n=1 Tax=Pseudomonas hunanensis TaxID=1247546 RepID=A0ACC6K3I3_9PSED|nr:MULTISPECIES: alpha-xenorhabdolysin family binary toxin subunit B [Pseudomonas]MBP2263995.1 hypothetical protein [Pseudomonas sp. BP8]MDR6712985.1 hypothetical protein [Pseudomonas hunanensis]HDS1734095.1 alpha-xenorhabdolysin family binary toxin subunit B [Pseudomonas putida]